MDKNKIWRQVLSELELAVTRGSFNTFFAQTKLIDLKDNIASIGCTSSYHCDLIEKRYYSLVKDILDRITKQKNSLTFSLLPKMGREEAKDIGPLFSSPTENQQEEKKEYLGRVGLKEDLTFENFCVSSSNEMAYAAATAVARAPGKTYNPLFLYGGVGVGKTHLMQAIGRKMLEKNPRTKIVYCVGEDFTNEIIEAIRGKTTKYFRDKYRKAEALLIDDIQFIAGKEKVQEEFFHTFNSLQREGGQVVLTSDKEPGEIAGLEDRLRSRFEGGLTIDIQQPDFELRTAILLTKAKQQGFDLPIEAAKLIAGNINSVRKLEGMLTKVQATALIKKEPITPELVGTILGKKNNEEKILPKVEPKDALSVVCQFYSLKQADIKGSCRKKSLALPRQVLMYVLRIELKMGLEEVGGFLGDRDHTTIMHGVDKITNLLSSDQDLRNDLSSIKQSIFG